MFRLRQLEPTVLICTIRTLA